MESSGTRHGRDGDTKDHQSAYGPDDLEVLGDAPASDHCAVHPESEARPHGRVTWLSVLALIKWQKYRCALTGMELTPDVASIDHIVPVRCGGEHTIENVQVLHRDVNKAKTVLTNDEFIHLCRAVVDHAMVCDLEASEGPERFRDMRHTCAK